MKTLTITAILSLIFVYNTLSAQETSTSVTEVEQNTVAALSIDEVPSNIDFVVVDSVNTSRSSSNNYNNVAPSDELMLMVLD